MSTIIFGTVVAFLGTFIAFWEKRKSNVREHKSNKLTNLSVLIAVVGSLLAIWGGYHSMKEKEHEYIGKLVAERKLDSIHSLITRKEDSIKMMTLIIHDATDFIKDKNNYIIDLQRMQLERTDSSLESSLRNLQFTTDLLINSEESRFSIFPLEITISYTYKINVEDLLTSCPTFKNLLKKTEYLSSQPGYEMGTRIRFKDIEGDSKAKDLFLSTVGLTFHKDQSLPKASTLSVDYPGTDMVFVEPLEEAESEFMGFVYLYNIDTIGFKIHRRLHCHSVNLFRTSVKGAKQLMNWYVTFYLGAQKDLPKVDMVFGNTHKTEVYLTSFTKCGGKIIPTDFRARMSNKDFSFY